MLFLKKHGATKQNLPTNCWSVLDHFVKLALKGLKKDHFVKARTHCEIFLSDYSTKCVFHDSFIV